MARVQLNSDGTFGMTVWETKCSHSLVATCCSCQLGCIIGARTRYTVPKRICQRKSTIQHVFNRAVTYAPRDPAPFPYVRTAPRKACACAHSCCCKAGTCRSGIRGRVRVRVLVQVQRSKSKRVRQAARTPQPTTLHVPCRALVQVRSHWHMHCRASSNPTRLTSGRKC